MKLKKLNPNRKIIAYLYKSLYDNKHPKEPYKFNHENFKELEQKIIKILGKD